MKSDMDITAKLALRTAAGMFTGKLMDAPEEQLGKAFNLMAKVLNGVANGNVSDDDLRAMVKDMLAKHKASKEVNEPARMGTTS